jgi:serine protease AprX
MVYRLTFYTLVISTCLLADTSAASIRPQGTTRMDVRTQAKSAGAASASRGVTSVAPSTIAKIDPALRGRLAKTTGRSRVIVRGTTTDGADGLLTALGANLGRRLAVIGGRVADIPNAALTALAANPAVLRIDLDRSTSATMERTGATIGSTLAREYAGVDGSGIGVAIIDSGVNAAHDDLRARYSTRQSIVHFVDFVNNRTAAYDDYGHGSHVAGIVAGNGHDSSGKRVGVAPGARLVVLKALNDKGQGTISTIIAAIDYVIANRSTYNIRVINLSVAAGVYQSFVTDPLTVACRRATEAGIVVVASAGNLGRDAAGQPLYRRVTAPGNAPWVLTVGASSHMGTTARVDDTMAGFSSRGPTHIDRVAKPDLVAPGVGIESLSDPNSYFYTAKYKYLLPGTVQTSYLPYLSLSGTSMSAPVVSATVALMLQANPALTPNAVKAILQYTAETRSGYHPLTQGAGFLNALGAVRLAAHFANPSAGLPGGTFDKHADGAVMTWSRRINWGNHRIGPGRLGPNRNAWAADIVWGAARTSTGALVTWGTMCGATDPECQNSVWSTDNDIVWGASCPETDPNCDNIVWGSTNDDNVVWGTQCPETDPDCDNIVWGSNCPETDPNCDNIVWGSNCPETDPDCDNIVWGSNCPETDPECDNIVWGSDTADDLIWGARFDMRDPRVFAALLTRDDVIRRRGRVS